MGNSVARVAFGNQHTREGPRTLGVASQRKKYDLPRARPQSLAEGKLRETQLSAICHNTPVAEKMNPLSSRGLG